jgi:protein-tyrosine-phosphatase
MTTPSDHDDGTQCHDAEDCRLTEPYVRTLLEREADEIARHFEGIFSVPSASIRTHLPVLAARFARQRLDATAKNQGDRVSTTPEVLFVCVHNAGRSQMAAALLHHHAQDSVIVRSAGSAPADTINPAVIAVMDELGLDLSQEFPKPLTTDAVQAADVVITMGCGDACPIFPGKRYLDWQLDDPAGKSIEDVRPIRDEIDRLVKALLAELVPASA